MNRVESAAAVLVPVTGGEIRPMESVRPDAPVACLGKVVLVATSLAVGYYAGKVTGHNQAQAQTQAQTQAHGQGKFGGDSAVASLSESRSGSVMTGDELLSYRVGAVS